MPSARFLSGRKKQRIFNDRKRKVFRKRISTGEVTFGLFFVFVVMLMGLWFATRGEAFDPGERDISMEVLVAQSVEDRLYRTPFKRWMDPSVAYAGEPAGPDLGIFPASLVGEGWEAPSRVQEFDESNLYKKINGQADQYMQFGFEGLHFIAIANPSQDLDLGIEVYDMGSFAKALGVFASQRSAGTRVEVLGNAHYYPTEAGALGIVDRFFFKLTASGGGPAVHKKALQFIGDFSAKLGSAEAWPGPMRVLSEGLGVAFQDIEYQLKDVFQYDFAEGFWFGRSGPDSAARYYLHEAVDAREAAALFERILEEHLFDFTLVERGENDAILKHEFLKTFVTLNRDGPYVFGVDGAVDGDGAKASMERLRASLPGPTEQ